MAMSTLANRLQKLQQTAPDPVFDFSHLSMEKLEAQEIKFGKTHVDKTYRHMWENEQALQPKLQVGSSRVSSLCGDEGREMRTDRNQGVSPKCHRTGEGGQSGQFSTTAGDPELRTSGGSEMKMKLILSRDPKT